MKDEFLATLSHELRTPLNAIVGWTHVLRIGRLGSGDVEKAIEVVERNAKAQTRLIDDLLDMNRIVSGKMRLECSFHGFNRHAFHHDDPARTGRQTPLEVLQRRYASGEVSTAEYEERKAKLDRDAKPVK